MQITQLKPTIEDIFFEHNFIVILESHLTYMRFNNNLSIVDVSKHQNYKYEGDLYGLLDDLSIEKKYHFITIRLNGYESSNDFKGDTNFLVLPDFNLIEMLHSVYQTQNSF